jgi:hypothetical protein
VQGALKTKAPSTSIGVQIKVYALNALLPPFGLVYVWRYYKQSGRASQRIAAIALVLTILMTAASLWITRDTLNAVNRMLNAALSGSIDLARAGGGATDAEFSREEKSWPDSPVAGPPTNKRATP